MGCSFSELSLFGRLRKQHFMGPLSMYRRLSNQEWSHLPKEDVARKVKFLFEKHAANRHKATVLTPGYHCESYSPDDNRYDLRPFLYRTDWAYQFRLIDAEVTGTKLADTKKNLPHKPRSVIGTNLPALS
jgi:NAD+ synthase (glutamine-hydrolysing)